MQLSAAAWDRDAEEACNTPPATSRFEGDLWSFVDLRFRDLGFRV